MMIMHPLLLRQTTVATLLFLLSGLASAAEPWTLQITNMDPVVRNELIWRCHISGEIPEKKFTHGPYVVQVMLTQGGRDIANSEEFSLTQLGQLVTGIDLVLTPITLTGTDEPATLTITVTDPTRRDLRHISRTLPTPISLQRSLEKHWRELEQRKDRDPLPALWFEQAGELSKGEATIAVCQHLIALDLQMEKWLAGVRNTASSVSALSAPSALSSSLRAFRDPIDDSVQPYRLHLPDGPPTTLVVLMADSSIIPRKSNWPIIADAWLVAARASGCAILEVYPAGDVAWNGISLQRVWTAVAAAYSNEPLLKSLPIAMVGHGRAAAGALQLAEKNPDHVRALGFIDGKLATANPLPVDPHERWLALQRPGEKPAHLISTAVAVSGAGDDGLENWSKRLILSGHLPLSVARSADQPAFWQALSTHLPIPMQREWVVLEPSRCAQIIVEELSSWGVAGSLLQDQTGNVRTFGIARLRIPLPSTALVDGKPYREPKAITSGPRKILSKATGPLAAYATAPFVVVIGTGESVAATADNHALGQLFVAAWAAHAHGRVRLLLDTEAIEQKLTGQHLVLIGNHRSNLLIANLVEHLPVQWDARSLTFEGQSFLRSDRRPFALAWPHPANDGRLLVILDGKPAWQSTGLPLQGLPDLVIGGIEPNAPPAVQRAFTNDWR